VPVTSVGRAMVEKVKGCASQEAIVAQVDKKNSFTRLQMQKIPWITEGQPPLVRWSKAVVMLFWFSRHRNRKLSTTSLVHRAVCYFKTGTDAAPVELVYHCVMRPGAVIPLTSARGITVNSRMDHRHMNFCKSKAKQSLSDRWRFSLRQPNAQV
jgi:hypothetical protein